MQNLAGYILAEHLALVQTMHHVLPDIERSGFAIRDALRRGNKVMFAGNGGSAADAQHLAAELVGRFEKERRGLPSFALTTDSSVLTAIANDYGFEKLFARQVEAHCDPGDVVVLISTSGNSANLVAAAEATHQLQGEVIGLLGRQGGELLSMCLHSVVVPSNNTARIQEMHIMIGHIWCSMAEQSFA
jgi:D-sedoheptulose 7-phosphate isomerase